MSLNKKWNDFRFRENVLKSILVSSMEEDKLWFPTSPRFILSELVNSTIEHVKGDAGKVKYQDLRLYDDNFEIEIWKYFEGEMEQKSRFLEPKIEESITKMVRFFWEDGYDGSFLKTELYSHFDENICPLIMDSTFSLPYNIVWDTQNRIIPSFTIKERRDIQEIGKIMRKYIETDLKLIRGY